MLKAEGCPLFQQFPNIRFVSNGRGFNDGPEINDQRPNENMQHIFQVVVVVVVVVVVYQFTNSLSLLSL